jgi:hypothetical protein
MLGNPQAQRAQRPPIGLGKRRTQSSPLLFFLLGLAGLAVGAFRYLEVANTLLPNLLEIEGKIQEIRALDERDIEVRYASAQKEKEELLGKFFALLPAKPTPREILLSLEDLSEKEGLSSLQVEPIAPIPDVSFLPLPSPEQDFFSFLGAYGVTLAGKGPFPSVYSFFWQLSRRGFIPREVKLTPEGKEIAFQARFAILYRREVAP